MFIVKCRFFETTLIGDEAYTLLPCTEALANQGKMPAYFAPSFRT